jgi:SAM-dependent methyltransferase
VNITESQQNYWEKRFQVEGRIWGDSPSRTAMDAQQFFSKAAFEDLLIPGSGYGRNSKYFSDAGYKVTGVEISKSAYEESLKFDIKSIFYNASVLDMSFISSKFDAIYCFNVLHLFREGERGIFIKECLKLLKPRGLMYFVVFSEKESTFGQGTETEKNTFESKPGRPVHYFSEKDLKDHFNQFTLITSGLTEDPENHGGKLHTHLLRYICVRASYDGVK